MRSTRRKIPSTWRLSQAVLQHAGIRQAARGRSDSGRSEGEAGRGLADEHHCQVELVAAGAAGRDELELFVRDIFMRQHGAEVRHFLPYLMGLRNEGTLCAVLGFGPAGAGEMFLEQYLEQPMEQVLAAALQRPVLRQGVMEVGNLAVSSAGGARSLITALTAYLRGAGHEWAVFTSGRGLQNSFSRMGIDLYALAPALPERLRDGAAHWGRYYDQHPLVCAAEVAQSHAALQQRMQRGPSAPLQDSVWRRAFAAGHGMRMGQAA